MKKITFCFFLFCCQYAIGQGFDSSKLNSLLNELFAQKLFMGNVSVHANGGEIYFHSVGYADVESKTPLARATRFRIGSTSKLFTAVLILMAIEEKKIRLTSTLSGFFPGILNSDSITISDMLRHRSGIANFTNHPGYFYWQTGPKNAEEILAFIGHCGSDFQPGTKTAYSNSNYVLLGFVLERIYGKSYQAILQEKIIQKLKLQDTYYAGRIERDNNECRSYGYLQSSGLEPETDISVAAGAGALVSTPSDLNHFAAALFSGELINRHSLSEMTKVIEGYGLGLSSFEFKDKKGFGHEGVIDGFSSALVYFPGSGFSFSVTSNMKNNFNREIMLAAASIFFDIPYQVPAFAVATLTANELSKFTGRYYCSQIGLEITVGLKDAVLYTQTKGQAPIDMQPIGDNLFCYLPAGIILEFVAAEGIMYLKQHGVKFRFNIQLPTGQ